ncbi:hypothetical protein K6119_03420 [Paracrocinitomix mangrovi]|uniref:hypothetical protein n=1 Tax=Paracrocinitomix mangrovi TaxID=2862509 RepID=UPI001C8E8419|nr:hypothetical protein [Paracrocinitomix mangrovi]UKN02565.1 hypothetical protein K6119_03420 [Paracrocinitomix mangrovi]
MKNLILTCIFLLGSLASAMAYNPGTPVTPPDTLKCDTLWLKAGGYKICTILADDGNEIKFSDCPQNAIVSTIPKSATKLSPADSALAAQKASECDTIYLKGGEIEMGHVKYFNSRKIVYTGCCQNCTTEKSLKRKSVDSIHYADGRRLAKGVYPTPVSNNTTITPSTTDAPKKLYSEQEKVAFTKRKKIFKILALSSAGGALVAALLLALVSTLNPFLLGFTFFGLIIAVLVFSMLFVKNKRKLEGKE